MDSQVSGRMAGRGRWYFLDSLRTVIILLVVLYHAGGIYESAGTWASFWLVDDPSTSEVLGIFLIMLDAFMMPVLFFVSGYLTPHALERKGGKGFITSRFMRLIVPWAVAVLTLIPLYKVIFLVSRGLPQEHWTTYFHFSANNLTSQSWLWFLPLLFVFSVVYRLMAKARLLPDRIPFKAAVVLTFLLGFAYSLAFDLMGARGWVGTAILDFQKERLLIYFLSFLLGSLAFRQQMFDEARKSNVLYIVANATAWIPITAYIFFLLMPYISPDGVLFSRVVDRSIVWVSFYLTLAAMMYILLESFRRYANKKPRRLWAELTANSYNVYLVHVIVIGVIGMLLLPVALPALVKFLIVAVLGYAASNLIASLMRRFAPRRTRVSRREVAPAR